ncbi:hypothetical protein NW754_008106 [Fusarium falciforme]|nr:hypothetical protein NW754_008106 [Fusarium falciforme]
MSSYPSADEEYDPGEPSKLDLNLDSLRIIATRVLQAACINTRPMTRGSSHEIFVLEFEESTRFARVRGTSAKEESEIATIRYVKQHTSIPVPEIYYQDLNPENKIGAAFVLMEKLPGRHLYKTWDGLSLGHKKVVLSEIASIIIQFSSLCFGKIKCLTQNEIGHVISPYCNSPQGMNRSW